jgi:hypothetical protein
MLMILHEEDTRETPNRDDMFIVSHTKKDGNPLNAVAGKAIVSGKYIILVVCSSFHPLIFCAGEDERNYRESVAAGRVCSHGSVYWSHNDACAQVLGREHFGRVRGVGLGPTPGKSASYTSGQRSISSAPTPRELEMAAEIERLKTLYKVQNIKLQEQNNQLQEQNNKYEVQQEDLAAVKHMVALFMAGKQPSRNNQEGDVLV